MKEKLRFGFTTGSCAAAASKAALIMLLTGENIHNVSIVTPKGIVFDAEIIDIKRTEDEVSCAIIKDGGDDPDVTTGARIYSTVRLSEDGKITIQGGKGVGKVTKPGLDQPIGEAAINSVPRKMITQNLEEVLRDYYKKADFKQKSVRTNPGVRVIISVPGGEEIAAKTFNPKLGIVGGISILGTTGIVEPMSDKAIIDTIKTEINVRKAENRRILLAAPGNYGLTFLHEKYGIDENIAVMSSNFIYDTVLLAKEKGFKKLLFAGHIGKLVKVAGGIKNTHSMYGDHRMEILTELSRQCLSQSSFSEIKPRLSECVMTDEAVRIIREYDNKGSVFELMALKIRENMQSWAEGALEVEVIVFCGENEELVSTKMAHDFIKDV